MLEFKHRPVQAGIHAHRGVAGHGPLRCRAACDHAGSSVGNAADGRALHAASHCSPQCCSTDRPSADAILTSSGSAVAIAGELVFAQACDLRPVRLDNAVLCSNEHLTAKRPKVGPNCRRADTPFTVLCSRRRNRTGMTDPFTRRAVYQH